MSLHKLDIYNVRNIIKQTINPASTFNFICGKNGSGKSAFIEAIFLLGRGKSFRASSVKSIINFNQSELVISAQIEHKSNKYTHLGIRMDNKSVEIHKNKQPTIKRSELAYTLPLQIIHPKSYELLDAGSQIRREFLDWGVFNHEPSFLNAWKNYKKALAQRNALLKLKAVNQLHVWNKEVVTYGTIVHRYRQEYSRKFHPVLIATIARFLSYSDFEFNLVAGWDETVSLGQLLEQDLERDIRDGFTHSGPHRGDFQLMLNRKLAKDVVSRGQLKLLVASLKLAQVELIYQERDSFGCILIDDFAAELDLENRAKILKYLDEMHCQVFITATEMHDFGDLSPFINHKMFHMEHGEIKVGNVPHETIS